MITVKLRGGLGNQMFQYAFGRSLSLKYNIPLYFDRTNFKKSVEGETTRDFELAPFDLKIPDSPARKNFLTRFFSYSRSVVINENNGYDSLDLFTYDSIILDGHFQNEKYFSGAEDIIRKDFIGNRAIKVEQDESYSRISESSSVAVHVRRGDYVTNSAANNFHTVLPESYYSEAILKMRQFLPSAEFVFFSEDIEWCKKSFGMIPNVNFVSFNPGSSPVNDLWLMSLASNFIIGNSSFSWWAAWLSEKASTKIIAPKNWFRNKTFDLPKRWIQL